MLQCPRDPRRPLAIRRSTRRVRDGFAKKPFSNPKIEPAIHISTQPGTYLRLRTNMRAFMQSCPHNLLPPLLSPRAARSCRRRRVVPLLHALPFRSNTTHRTGSASSPFSPKIVSQEAQKRPRRGRFRRVRPPPPCLDSPPPDLALPGAAALRLPATRRVECARPRLLSCPLATPPWSTSPHGKKRKMAALLPAPAPAHSSLSRGRPQRPPAARRGVVFSVCRSSCCRGPARRASISIPHPVHAIGCLSRTNHHVTSGSSSATCASPSQAPCLPMPVGVLQALPPLCFCTCQCSG